MDTPNAEKPRPLVMWILMPLTVLMATFMYFFFASDEWTTARIIGQVAFTAIAVGMVVATVLPSRGWWGLRIVAFVIFAAYFWYLISELVLEAKSLEITVRRSESSPFNATLGFLFFGVPCLIYSMWGSTWGKLGHENPKSVTRGDMVTFYIAWGAQVLFLALSALAGIAVLWKWFVI